MEPGGPSAAVPPGAASLRLVGRGVLRPEDREAFGERATRLTTRGLEVTGGVIIALTLLAWPTDRFVFDPGTAGFRALVQWRLLMLFVCVVGVLALRVGPYFARHPFVVGWTIYSTVSAGTGWLMGTVGGIESPLFYGIYTAPLLTVMLVVGLGPRILAVAGIVASYLACFFAADPRHLDHPLIVTPVVWLGASAVTVVVVGHVVYLLLRENFLQQQALDRFNRGLEQVVSQQTGEIRLLATNLVSVQEEERTRIAREVHDELGQTLTGLRMEVDRLDGRTVAGGGDARGHDLGRAKTLIDAIHGSIDGILNDLRPGTLATSSLAGAIETLGERTHREHGLRCTVEVDIDEDELPEGTTIAIYRIVQEALTNACRHAQAGAVDVQVRGADAVIEVTVRDDGQGFEVDAVRSRSGFGLLGIRERARLLGGQCRVSSRPGVGTEVVVRFPGPDGRLATEVQA